jgi:hypothetical protein
MAAICILLGSHGEARLFEPRHRVRNLVVGKDLYAQMIQPLCRTRRLEQYELERWLFDGKVRVAGANLLKQLRKAGLLKSRRSGIWSVYEIDGEGMKRLASLADSITGKWQNNG